MLRHDSQQICIRAEPISLRAGITDEAAHWQVSGVNKLLTDNEQRNKPLRVQLLRDSHGLISGQPQPLGRPHLQLNLRRPCVKPGVQNTTAMRTRTVVKGRGFAFVRGLAHMSVTVN